MRRTCVCLILIGLVAIFITAASAHYIVEDSPSSQNNHVNLLREKRQVETFDSEDYPTGTSASEGVEDEPSFWDRVVKIAVKLFSRFIEWLNT